MKNSDFLSGERMNFGQSFKSNWSHLIISFFKEVILFIMEQFLFILRLLQDWSNPINDKKCKKEEKKGFEEKETTSQQSAGEEIDKSYYNLQDKLATADIRSEKDNFSEPVVESNFEQKKFVEPSSEQSKNTLVIKNLPFKFKSCDLDKLLVLHETKPKNVRLLRDEIGRFSGMAFIRCQSKEEAQKLIRSMDGLDIGGRNVQVEFKTKKSNKRRNSECNNSSHNSNLRSSKDEISVNGVERNLIGKTSKLSVSAEQIFSDKIKLQKFPQERRRSTGAVDSTPFNYTHFKFSNPNFEPTIRLVRQPFGPDGNSRGFSLEYQQSRSKRTNDIGNR
jgi:RNA recognition motif-containing protein